MHLTTEILSKFLADYRTQQAKSFGKQKPPTLLTEVINRIDEFPADTPEGEKGRQWGKDLSSIIGAHGLESCLMYWDYRDKIQELQIDRQISGVYTRTLDIAGESISFPDWDDQLAFLDSDLAFLAPSLFLINWFADFAEDHGYTLHESIDDETEIETSKSKVWQTAKTAVGAYIFESSCEWTEKEDGWTGVFVKKFFPDKIELTVLFDRPDDGDGLRRYFCAYHSDLSRRPWM